MIASGRFRSIEFVCVSSDCTEVLKWPRSYNVDQVSWFPLLRCPKCELFIEIRGIDSHEFFVGCVKDDLGATICGFREYSEWVPSSVRSALLESIRCHEIAAWTASTILARKAVELIARDLGARGKTLFHQLQDLKTRGLLNERAVGGDEAARSLGNIAVHSTPNDLQTIHEIQSSWALLYVYDASKQVYLGRKLRGFRLEMHREQFAKWLYCFDWVDYAGNEALTTDVSDSGQTSRV